MTNATIGVESAYVGGPARLGDERFGLISGIAKRAVDRTATLGLTSLNLDGDDQADRTVHGGLDKAVYVHPSEHLPVWADELGQPELARHPLTVAAFGENISTTGVTEADAHIGDVWAWGTARLQVCQPRWPCQKLTVHRHSAHVGPLMRATGRTGWYLRVIQTGTVPAAGPITVVDRHPALVTVIDANRAMLDRRLVDHDLVERVVALGDALAAEWRLPLLQRLRAEQRVAACDGSGRGRHRRAGE
jgi:MOSC domain-containing protein YiiM